MRSPRLLGIGQMTHPAAGSRGRRSEAVAVRATGSPSSSVASDEHVWAGRSALSAGRWEDARAAFEAVLAERETAEAWAEPVAAEFAGASVERGRELARRSPEDPHLRGYVDDAARFARRRSIAGAALAAYVAAVAAEAIDTGGFAAERRRQGEWLAARLALDPAPFANV